MRLIFQDPTFSFELLRTLGYSPYGGADIGECLSTAYRIEEGNFDSWHTEWLKTAERVFALGQESMNRGKKQSAQECYLRASNYYRTAEFFLHENPGDPRMLRTWDQSRQAFRLALPLLSCQAEEVNIPYEGRYLPGYFYRLDDLPRPTLIIHGGYDSTGEELYFGGAATALQRGYHCLTFEGPGQGAVIREQMVPFRHDWEHVVTPVVDYLFSRPEVDKSRIALMGISMGGYLAPRAAAYEHRLAACIANDGLFSFQVGELRNLAPHIPHDRPDQLEAFIDHLMSVNSSIRWAMHNGLFTFQARSITELINKTKVFTLEGVAELVKCPVLVCEAEGDHFFGGQPEKLYDALQCRKTMIRFTAEDAAEEHCQFGAMLYFNQRLFEWLDDTLEVKYE